MVAFGAESDTTLVGNSPGTYWAQLAGLSVTAALRIAIENRKSLAVSGWPSDHFRPDFRWIVYVLSPLDGTGGPAAALIG